MFCKSCGEQIDDDSKYCSFCGTKQSSNLKPNLQDKIDASNYRDYKDNIVEQSITNSASLVSQTKYDPTYKKEEDVMVVGILLLLAIVFSFIGPRRFQDNDTFAQFKAISAVVSLILRIFISIWVVKIAKRQNRDEYRWGLFAFILPSIALIVIATRRKLFANVEIVGGVSNEENSKMLAGKAQTYFSENKFSESLRFSQKAIDLDPDNELAKEIHKMSKASIEKIQNIKEVNQGLSRSDGIRVVITTDGKMLEIHSTLAVGYTVGDKVFINGQPAPAGRYKLGWMDYLTVDEGKIKKL